MKLKSMVVARTIISLYVRANAQTWIFLHLHLNETNTLNADRHRDCSFEAHPPYDPLLYSGEGEH